jgi:hypothetical protein
MSVWADLGNLSPRGTYTAIYSFDDSVVSDYDTQFLQDTQAVTLGTMSKAEWRMRQYGEDETTAKKMIALITAEQPQVDFFPASE